MKLLKPIKKLTVLLFLISCQSREIDQKAFSVPGCKTDSCVSSGIKGIFFTVKQPTSYSCWATVLSMMFSWKNQKYVSEKNLLEPYPQYLELFDHSTTTGIGMTEEISLYDTLGLTIERQLEPTIKGWCEMLDNFGPLSITIDARPPYGTMHAILMLGLYGADTGLKTRIVYADPATGKIVDDDFLVFLKMYESKYSVDWPIQIIHFKN